MASNNGYELSVTQASGTYKINSLTIGGVAYTIKQTTYDSVESETLIKQLYSGTVVNAIVPDGVLSLHPYLFYGMTTLQSVDFNQVETIPIDCCYNCTNLLNITFSPHTRVISDYAFYHCTKLTDISIPHTITSVGQYAFNQAGYSYSQNTHTFDFIDDVGVETSIGNYAFQQSHLSHLKLVATNIGDQAFSSCNSLVEVELKVDNGAIGSYAFSSNLYLTKFVFDPTSVVTNLGAYAFQNLAQTTYASANISAFDFRNSTFTLLQSEVWGSCKFNGVVYMPSTLTSINGNFVNNATGNWTFYFNSVPSVSSSSYLRNDTGTFTIKYCFPYELLDQASSTTNWTTHISQMLGYGTGYAQGTTLPEYARSSGVAITWYSDQSLTIPITISASEDDVYYCTLGTTRLVWFVEEPTLVDGSVSISDGTNTYSVGDPIAVQTNVTITPTPTDPTKNVLYMLVVNGQDYTQSGIASNITMDRDLVITCIYWDGTNPPILPTLSDNSWALIQIASKSGNIPNTWAIGDTKTLTYDGQTFVARLVDKTGKYTRVSDGSTAYLKFELTKLIANGVAFNPSNVNNPNQSTLLTDMNSGTIYGKIDSSLTSVIEPVNVKVSQGGGSSTENTLIDYQAKFFLQREHDLFDTRTYSVQAEWNYITAQDEWYQTHNTASDRIKQYGSSNTSYWEISPGSGNSYTVCSVYSNGGASTYGANSTYGVSLCFAL